MKGDSLVVRGPLAITLSAGCNANAAGASEFNLILYRMSYLMGYENLSLSSLKTHLRKLKKRNRFALSIGQDLEGVR